MKRIFLALAVIILCAQAAAAQAAPNAQPQKGAAPQSAELAEAARLNAEVVRLFAEGKYDEALAPARRVVELRERALGGEHMLVAYALNNLGSILAQKGHGDEARRTLARALAVFVKNGEGEGDIASGIYNRLGVVRFQDKDYKEAAQLFRRSLEIREKVHGASDPSTVPALLNLADANYLRGDREEARATLSRAVEVLAKNPPKRDPTTLKKLQTYVCLMLGERAEDLAWRVMQVARRLENPERAAELERLEAEGDAGRKTVVAGGGTNGRAIDKPVPSYPPRAREAGATGVVLVRIMVDEQGRVVEAEAVCGHPELRRASVEAARRARFTPTLLDGRPVQVTGVITYNFVIQ